MSRTKTVQKGMIRPDALSNKFLIDLSVEELKEGLEDMITSESSSSEIAQQENNCIKWKKETPKPEVLESVIRQIQGMGNIGKDVEGWNITYYPPPATLKDADLVIPPAEMNTACRYVACIGTREVMEIKASMMGRSGEGEQMISQSQVINLPLGICASCSIGFNNKTNGSLSARKGFRATKISKNPLARHILVFDGVTNMDSFMKKIKSETKNLTGKEMSTEDLKEQLTQKMHLSDTQLAIQLAKSKTNDGPTESSS